MLTPMILIDFGSTWTKVCAVDRQSPTLLGTAAAPTTAASDVMEGLRAALALLPPELADAPRRACSSAAGGLKMVAIGLVPELTAAAARMAALGAGAKLIKTYSYQLTPADIGDIDAIRPDIVLLTGGTDGGNTACIEHNARSLASCQARFPILVAGNRNARESCLQLLAGREAYVCPNVMPRLDRLETAPAKEKIRSLFLERIIRAKGLSQASGLLDSILMPTPAAVLTSLTLLAGGTSGQAGLGDLVALDLGGATCDVYSIASGQPRGSQVMLKGLPEPYAKRTVEGDLGVRHNIDGIIETAGLDAITSLSGLDVAQVTWLTAQLSRAPGSLTDSKDAARFEFALAASAIEHATLRHAGRLETVYTPQGPVMLQTGKDLTGVKTLILSGGPLIHAADPLALARFALCSPKWPLVLKPRDVRVLLDRSAILPAMGLLAGTDPDAALTLLKKELMFVGTVQQEAGP
ncbi:MAG: methylaspartate mutase accessory protein GlmL [Eubacteriales bacterium]|nr:methylaspartate mutase accessory protein GlmL [Eubacteriales bacterium]